MRKGTVTFDGDAPTLDVAAQWENLQWPLRGAAVVNSATGEGTLRGSMPYDFTTTAQVDGPNLPPAQGSARGVLSKEQLTVAQYDVKAFDGTVTGSAQLQFAQPRAWKLTTRADDINPVELHEEFPGRIDVRAQAEGKGFDKRASFRLALDESARHAAQRARACARNRAARWQDLAGQRCATRIRRRTRHARRQACATRSRRSGRSVRLRSIACCRRPPARFESTGSASGALKSPHVVAKLHGENLRYAGWLARAAGDRCRCGCCRRQPVAPGRAGSPARTRQPADRSAAGDRHRRRDGSSHRPRRHRLPAAAAAGRAARRDGNRRPLRQGSLERDDHHDRAVDRRSRTSS